MSIKDFFKPKVMVKSGSDEGLSPAFGESLKPKPILLDNENEPRAVTKSNCSSPSTGSKRKAPFIIEDSEDDEIFKAIPDTLEEFASVSSVVVVEKKKPTPTGISKEKKKEEEEVFDGGNSDEDDEDFVVDDLDGEINSKKKPAAKRAASKATAKATPDTKKPKSDSIESTDAESTPKKKFNYYAFAAKKSSGPSAPGSKEIPEGSPDCLVGLAFVFTGELSSISRDDASDLVKRYGGRVTTAPSGKTDYVVVGEAAGQSKLEKIEKLNLKTLDEDGFFDLIRKQSVLKTPAAKVSQMPKEPIKTVVDLTSSKKTEQPSSLSETPVCTAPVTTDLWTVKWAPKKPEDLIGNHSIYEKLKGWLGEWQRGSPSEFKAVLLSGPPGIGKTTMAHMACKQAGFDIVELNASDTRNKKTLHDEVREVINNSSLGSFFKPTNNKDHILKKQCIIMDECDGMSAGDRGGMAELIQLIKKTKMPIVCACNDRSSPKVRSLANYCLDLRFRRPEARQVVPRITEICRQEGLSVGSNTIEELVASTQGDLRQILNLLSTYRLTGQTMSFDESKHLGQASKKDIEEGPFDGLHSLLSGQSNSRMSLSQKIDLYFIDNGLMPLMVQENYLKSRANSSRIVYESGTGAPIENANFMTLTWAAADSISSADRVDSLIRGYNQEWSLAPLHGVHSCVRPAYFCSGNLSGRVDFASWLGQNSKQQKYLRILKELTQHLYLHTRANKQTLCMDYAPVMATILMSRLTNSSIDDAIKFLDEYQIAKEDVEPLLEIVLDSSCNSQAYAKLPTATKSAFTRKYNQGSHLLPYALGATSAPVRKIKTDINPDDNNGDEDFEEPVDGDLEESEDVSKDKMIKSKSLVASKSASKRGGKK